VGAAIIFRRDSAKVFQTSEHSHNVHSGVAVELLLAWNRMRCRPPPDDAEVAQVVASITKLRDAESALEQERIGSDEFGLRAKVS
jgi:hypothetical protein